MQRSFTLCAILVMTLPLAAEDYPFESAIQAFEKQDAENPPEKGGILFVGSSSIRMWDTDKAFPEHSVINRGFGGSEIPDVLHFTDRIVLPYEPRLIVFYAGDNDISAGRTAQQVTRDFRAFVTKVREKLPETRIIFIAIKPSIARWGLYEEMRTANEQIQEFSKQEEKVEYLDIATPMLGDDGMPRKELFIADGLHLSEEGYALWNGLIRPLLNAKGAN